MTPYVQRLYTDFIALVPCQYHTYNIVANSACAYNFFFSDKDVAVAIFLLISIL